MADAATVPDLAPLRAWFASYCSSFRSTDPDAQRNFDLKELHTRNVCRAALLIAQGGDPRRVMLVEVAALCHDLGRFQQYRDFRTFKDSESVNHAHLSGRIVQHHDLLSFLPADERESVLLAVRLHNAFEVPSGLPRVAEDLLRLVRDADKVDIWRVFIEYFNTPEEERASAAGLGFPDLPHCSPDVVATVRSRRMVRLSLMKSLNDFKLLQLSWLYDINFPATFRLVEERGILEQFASILPKDRAVLDLLSGMQDYLERNLERGAH